MTTIATSKRPGVDLNGRTASAPTPSSSNGNDFEQQLNQVLEVSSTSASMPASTPATAVGLRERSTADSARVQADAAARSARADQRQDADGRQRTERTERNRDNRDDRDDRDDGPRPGGPGDGRAVGRTSRSTRSCNDHAEAVQARPADALMPHDLVPPRKAPAPAATDAEPCDTGTETSASNVTAPNQPVAGPARARADVVGVAAAPSLDETTGELDPALSLMLAAGSAIQANVAPTESMPRAVEVDPSAHSTPAAGATAQSLPASAPGDSVAGPQPVADAVQVDVSGTHTDPTPNQVPTGPPAVANPDVSAAERVVADLDRDRADGTKDRVPTGDRPIDASPPGGATTDDETPGSIASRMTKDVPSPTGGASSHHSGGSSSTATPFTSTSVVVAASSAGSPRSGGEMARDGEVDGPGSAGDSIAGQAGGSTPGAAEATAPGQATAGPGRAADPGAVALKSDTTAAGGPHASSAAQRPLFGHVDTRRMEMDLSDEGLGPLRLQTLAQGGVLHVSLQAADPHVREAIARQSYELRNDLERAGMQLGSFDVGGYDHGRQQSGLHEDSPSPRTLVDAGGPVVGTGSDIARVASPRHTSTGTAGLDLKL